MNHIKNKTFELISIRLFRLNKITIRINIWNLLLNYM